MLPDRDKRTDGELIANKQFEMTPEVSERASGVFIFIDPQRNL